MQVRVGCDRQRLCTGCELWVLPGLVARSLRRKRLLPGRKQLVLPAAACMQLLEAAALYLLHFGRKWWVLPDAVAGS